MSTAGPRASEVKLVGGALCLDLVNTVGWRMRAGPEDWERLRDYDDLLDWSVHAGALGAFEGKRLSRLAKRHPKETEAALARARALREAVYRILMRLIDGLSPTAEDLAIINAELARAPTRRSLVRSGARIGWDAPADSDRLDRMLSPLVWSAADLMASHRTQRVKQCGGEGCGWLFVDESRNASRRWCSMESCGNRAKAKRHYARHRGKENGR
ncbi:MAG: CGNR zinc finger domain-containing protein [Proteobacteria bacterium]|nr:CGNR zinc finger domain-containing protein [Pseudomonadota bacterium]MBI3497506.1 CGNR zinc finger domain-containing protein [Pseudomonadota bacterium]